GLCGRNGTRRRRLPSRFWPPGGGMSIPARPRDRSPVVASALNFVVHLAESGDDKSGWSPRFARPWTPTTQIISNEVYRPDPTDRAVPEVPLRTETVERLTEPNSTRIFSS